MKTNYWPNTIEGNRNMQFETLMMDLGKLIQPGMNTEDALRITQSILNLAYALKAFNDATNTH